VINREHGLENAEYHFSELAYHNEKHDVNKRGKAAPEHGRP
jgi:hypothetical protein